MSWRDYFINSTW